MCYFKKEKPIITGINCVFYDSLLVSKWLKILLKIVFFGQSSVCRHIGSSFELHDFLCLNHS